MGQILLLAINFCTAPYIVHHLGAELFGVVTLVQSVAGFAGVLNLGIGRALAKYVSELFWKKDTRQINLLFQTAWTTCIVSGLIGVVLFAGAQQWVTNAFFSSSGSDDQLATFAIYVAAFGLFSSMLSEAISAIPLAAQRFGYRNLINILVGAVASLGSVLLLAEGYSVRAVLLVNLISNLVGLVAYTVLSRILIPELNLLPGFNVNAFKKLFGFSLPLLLSAISALIVSRADRFILAYYLPLAAVAFYTLPYSISDKLSMGVGNVVSVVLPLASELHSRGAYDKIRDLYLRSSRVLALMTLPLTAILVSIPWSILKVWLGVEYAEQGAIALSLLGLAAFLNAFSAVPTVTSLALNRAWLPSMFGFATSAVNLVANFILVPRYGINGAALAQLIPQAVMVPFFIVGVNRMIDLRPWKFIRQALLGPLACAVVQSVFLIGLSPYTNSLATLSITILASLGLFAVLALFSAVTEEERLALMRLIYRPRTRAL
jgi:O-antigen/teichoic acid export membrane protein